MFFHDVVPQLKSFHNELLTELEKKVELDARYLTVSHMTPPISPIGRADAAAGGFRPLPCDLLAPSDPLIFNGLTSGPPEPWCVPMSVPCYSMHVRQEDKGQSLTLLFNACHLIGQRY